MRLITSRQFKIVLVIVAALVCAVVFALAANPHFVGKVTATLVGPNVLVCWKEAGLGNNQLIDYVASANATATYVCVNNGGQCPNAANKITVSGPVSATGTFSSGQNGQITQCLTFVPPGPGGFSCPSGQTLTLADVSYSGIQIKDVTNNVTKTAAPSGLSATPFICP
ncbi:MAG: hypothetical protein ACREBU_25605 [Nitrososphaera sp.]